MEVEDHPLEYGDFEGTVPKGEYGGGTVMLWDRGYWVPEPGFENIGQALRNGELKVRRRGPAAARILGDCQNEVGRTRSRQLDTHQAPR